MRNKAYDRLLVGATFALTGFLALRAPGLGDYSTDAGPALSSIADGHLSGFFSHQPAMGPLSLYLRAPFAALGLALHDGTLGVYRWGALPCLLAVASAAIWLGRIAMRSGSGRLAPVLIVAIALLNPLIGDALYWGHPEELLTASLAVGSLLAACERRVLLSAVFAGLAIASKQWAVLIVVPIVLLLGRERVRVLIVTAGVAALSYLPMVVGNFTAFRHALDYISTPQPVVTVFTWLYPLSPSGSVRITNIFGDLRIERMHQLLGIETLARPLIVAVGLAIPAYLWWRSGRRLGVEQALTATALVLLLRCAFDPGSAAYYHFPALLILLALDATAGRRIPAAGLVAGAVALVVLDRFPAYLSPGLANGCYIAATVAACGLLARRLVAPPRVDVAAPPGGPPEVLRGVLQPRGTVVLG